MCRTDDRSGCLVTPGNSTSGTGGHPPAERSCACRPPPPPAAAAAAPPARASPALTRQTTETCADGRVCKRRFAACIIQRPDMAEGQHERSCSACRCPHGMKRAQHCRCASAPTCIESYRTFRMRVPSSWSLSPAAVTVKSTTRTLALSSGLKCGFGSSVVQYSLNPSLTSTCAVADRDGGRLKYTSSLSPPVQQLDAEGQL